MMTNVDYDDAIYSHCQYLVKHNYLVDDSNGLLVNGKLTIHCEVCSLIRYNQRIFVCRRKFHPD